MRTAYCFDLDGTLTKREILPLLAKEIGLYEEMYALTQATIKGLIPFNSSFKLRCKLLGDIPVSQVQEIISRQKIYPKLFSFIRDKKEDVFIITGNLDVWVKPLLDRLDCKSYCSTARVENDKIAAISAVLNKADAVKEIRKEYDRVIAIGDGMGDVPMLEHAHVKIAFGGVHMPVDTVIELSDYITFSETGICNILDTL